MKKKNYIISISLFLILVFATYFFILKDYNFADIIKTIKTCNINWIMLSFLSLILYLFFECLFLKRILSYIGHKINYYQAFGYVITEKYFSAITPSSMGGQPMQMVEMKKDHIGYQKTSIIVLLNTAIYKTALILLATISFLLYPKLLFTNNTFFNWVVILGYITTVLLIIFFIILVYSKKIVKLFKKILFYIIKRINFIKDKEKKITKIEKMLDEYQMCAKITKDKPIILIESLFILLLQRIALLSISYFIYRAFGLNEYTIFELIAFQICITLGSDLMPTPGGVMINEGLLLKTNELLYGSSLALSGMLVQRSINFYFLVIFSGFAYLYFHFKKRKPSIKIEREES